MLVTASSRRPASGDGPPGPARAVQPSLWAVAAWPATVLEFAGRDRAHLIAELDSVARAASRLPGSSLDDLNRLPQAEGGPARAAIIGSDPQELAALASTAAAILRSSAGPLPSRPQLPGIYLSEGARGRVALLFGGLAVTSLEHSAALAGSAATLGALDRLGVEPCVAAAYGLGEIIGLAWAGAITFGEAARLAALRAELLCIAHGNALMARVRADRETTARLLEGSGLVVAVDEGPRQQVVTGPTPSVRMLPYRAADLGVTAEVLEVLCGLHSPAMRPCVAPMAAVASCTRVGTPRRRLISSVTGLDFALSGDPAGLLARQLDRPAQLAAALALASAAADLVLLATPDPALAEAAASCCKVPVIQPPLDLDGRPGLELLAALYTAGAIGSVRRFLSAPPAIRVAEPQTTAPPLVARLTAGPQIAARLILAPPISPTADPQTLSPCTLDSTRVLRVVRLVVHCLPPHRSTELH
jgi:enediyne polyketide synthase